MKLKQIAESIKVRDMFEGFNETELTEEYPENFNFNELNRIHSYAGKKRYIQTHLGKQISSGSARIVYRVDETKVLKLAKNKKGLAQNKVEIDWGSDNYFKDILAHTYKYDNENYYWVEMELALKVKSSDFKRLWGVNFEYLAIYLSNKYSEIHPFKRRIKYQLDDNIKNDLDENEHVMDIIDFMFNTKSEPGDYGKLSSWGRVFREGIEHLVLIDFGLTSEVYESYYS